MKNSTAWFLASQAWLAAGVIAPNGWPGAVCVILGTVWFGGSLILDIRERKHG